MWIADGYIVDTKGNPVNGVSIILVNMITKKPVDSRVSPYMLPDNTYSAWTDIDPDAIGVLFHREGLNDVVKSITALQMDPEVIMKAGGGNGLMMLAAAGLVLVAVNKRRRQTGKMGALSTGDILPIFLLVGGAIGFNLIIKLLQKLGLMNSPNTIALDNLATDPNSFWNPNFWANIPPGQSYYSPITEATAASYAKTIYDSFGAFNDNEETVAAVFKSLRTQANASFIAWKFAKLYGEDLLKWLRGGWWPQDRLSDDDVYEINKFVTKLPKY